MRAPLRPQPAAAGKLIYSLYGAKAEAAFVKNWGVGLAIEQAQSFQEVVEHGLKAGCPGGGLPRRSHRRR